MKKFMNWLANSFAPTMNKVFSRPWIAAISSSMQRILPFILTGSLIFFYNVFRSYVEFLPDLGIIGNYSFGMLGLIISYMMTHQCMEKLNHNRYEVNSGIVAICIFIMVTKPVATDGGTLVDFGRFGPSGIFVGMIVGLFVAIIFHLYSKLHFLENNTSIPDFVSEWINNIIPITVTLGIAMVLVFNLNIDVFLVITEMLMPLQSFGQTLPGLILICFAPVFFYSIGVSSWMFSAIITPIFLAGIQGNIDAVAAGGVATNIVTNETVYTAALITMGGMGATLTLNILMLFSKSKRLKVMGRVCIGPSIFNINEPIVFGTPIVFNPILMLPMWINGIIGPIVIWFAMSLGWLNIPNQLMNVGQIPAPFSSIIITEDLRAIIWYIILFVLYIIVWYPFFKVYEKECIQEEIKETTQEIIE